MIRRGLVATIAVSLLAGCAMTKTADAPAAVEAPRRIVFLCDRGANMAVTFQGQTATLEGNGSTVHLVAQPVASGIHYAGEGHDLRGKGPEATWTDPSGTVRACRDQEWAMKQPQVQEPLARLEGTTWRLVHFQSSDDAIGTVVPPRVERYTLHFMADGALALALDCNRASARWEAEPTSPRGGSLIVRPGPMTRAMCGPGAMDTRIAQDMGRVRSFTIADNTLNLALKADAGIYVWEPAPDGVR